MRIGTRWVDNTNNIRVVMDSSFISYEHNFSVMDFQYKDLFSQTLHMEFLQAKNRYWRRHFRN
jgi:hypothetical protein